MGLYVIVYVRRLKNVTMTCHAADYCVLQWKTDLLH